MHTHMHTHTNIEDNNNARWPKYLNVNIALSFFLCSAVSPLLFPYISSFALSNSHLHMYTPLLSHFVPFLCQLLYLSVHLFFFVLFFCLFFLVALCLLLSVSKLVQLFFCRYFCRCFYLSLSLYLSSPFVSTPAAFFVSTTLADCLSLFIPSLSLPHLSLSLSLSLCLFIIIFLSLPLCLSLSFSSCSLPLSFPSSLNIITIIIIISDRPKPAAERRYSVMSQRPHAGR